MTFTRENPTTMSSTYFERVMELRHAKTSDCPFEYTIKVNEKNWELVIRDGYHVVKMAIVDNILNLAKYFQDLIRVKYHGNVAVEVPAVGGPRTFGIYYTGKHPETNDEMETPLFRISHMYIPLTDKVYINYIYKFLEDIYNAMIEYEGRSGHAPSASYMLPHVSLKKGKFLEMTITTPRLNGTDGAAQTASLGYFNLIGMIPILRAAGSEQFDLSAGFRISGKNFDSMLVRNSVYNGWTFSSIAYDGVINRVKFHIGDHLLLDVSNSLEKLIKEDPTWSTVVLKGESYESAIFINGDKTCKLSEFDAMVACNWVRTGETKPVTSSSETKVVEIKSEPAKPEAKTNEPMSPRCLALLNILEYPVRMPKVHSFGDKWMHRLSLECCLEALPDSSRITILSECLVLQLKTEPK